MPENKMQNKINRETFMAWIPFAVAITLLCGLVYGSVQQVYRQSANDPQIQIAEDVSAALAKDVPPQAIAGTNTTDISKSLSAFIIIYNKSKASVVSTAVLDGKTPQVPNGVFDSASKTPQDRFTWEPKKGVRIAAVMQKYGGKTPGYLLVGRSLEEVEKRELTLEQEVGIAWIVILIATFVSIYFVDQKMREAKTRRKTTK